MIILPKIIEFVKKNGEQITLFIAVVLISLFSFAIGYLMS